jgi:hypothetical protein
MTSRGSTLSQASFYEQAGLRTFIAVLRKVIRLDRLGRAEDGILGDVAAEMVPCVPSHLRCAREAIVVGGNSPQASHHNGE